MNIKDYANLIKNSGITARKVIEYYYKPMNKCSDNYRVECPWHDSKNKVSLIVPEGRDIYFWQCFSCSENGDPIDFVSKYYGITKTKACDMINSHFSLNITQNKIANYKAPPKKEYVFEEKSKNMDLTTNLLNAYQQHQGYEYWCNRRKLDKKIVDKYKLCQSNPIKIVPKEHLPTNYLYYNMIMPIWDNKKVISVICRRFDNSDKYTNYINLKKIPIYIFNQNCLWDDKVKVIHICESYLDALSLESIGKSAIALNSTSNKKYLVDLMTKYKNKIKNKIFVICGDNDDAGQKMALFLGKELNNLKFKNFCFNQKKGNDINELLQKDLLISTLDDKSNYYIVSKK